MDDVDYRVKPSDWHWMSGTARRRWIQKAAAQMALKGIPQDKSSDWVYEEARKIAAEDREKMDSSLIPYAGFNGGCMGDE